MNFLRRKQQQQLIEIQDPRHDGLNGSPFPLPPPLAWPIVYIRLSMLLDCAPRERESGKPEEGRKDLSLLVQDEWKKEEEEEGDDKWAEEGER